ncbi:MerR family transcriptional regulator [Streptomyces sp. MUM 203J]|uniref:MerR family transcriptional regulator n=1 Tax=Streptomyces sp. MUM 203J TaxID=2791990 RepID=UPI001F041106|nr:MerR family transcriptional regulator [Streptomyces sp. MUM 203J]MCH0539045.1 MerR family transcriptional regulator [Streptomyces sp. MUM 203J]
MRLAELSGRSGVSTATIKYYLREGLLPPGRRVSATTAEYEEEHLRRLRLVRALIQVGGLPVAKVREVLGHADDESLGGAVRLGAAMWALPQGPEPEEGAQGVTEARVQVDRLLAALGWASAREMGELSPVYRSLVALLAALDRLGYPCDADMLEPYARLMHQVAVRDHDGLERCPTETERVETAVVGAVLFEPVLTALHRLAQEEETYRRHGL